MFFCNILRDGVGDGQLKMCQEYEIPQMENACITIDADYKPKFTYIVVQKRINTRIFVVIIILNDLKKKMYFNTLF